MPPVLTLTSVGGSGTRIREVLPVSVDRVADAPAGGMPVSNAMTGGVLAFDRSCTESVATSASSESEKSALSKKWGG